MTEIIWPATVSGYPVTTTAAVVDRPAAPDALRDIEDGVLGWAAESRSLSGKVAVISGGAKVVGAATAQRMRNEGARVAVIDFGQLRAAKLAGDAGSQSLIHELDNGCGQECLTT